MGFSGESESGSVVSSFLLPHGLYSPPGSSVHGILQARILEWIAIPFSGDLPNSGGKPRSPPLQADSSPSEPPGKPRWVVGKESACGAEGCGLDP